MVYCRTASTCVASIFLCGGGTIGGVAIGRTKLLIENLKYRYCRYISKLAKYNIQEPYKLIDTFFATGRRVLPHDPLSHRLPVQASKGGIHDSHLPSQHQLKWIHLLRHPQVAVVAGTHNLERYQSYYKFIQGILKGEVTLYH
jgi:hypothetical protein